VYAIGLVNEEGCAELRITKDISEIPDVINNDREISYVGYDPTTDFPMSVDSLRSARELIKTYGTPRK